MPHPTTCHHYHTTYSPPLAHFTLSLPHALLPHLHGCSVQCLHSCAPTYLFFPTLLILPMHSRTATTFSPHPTRACRGLTWCFAKHCAFSPHTHCTWHWKMLYLLKSLDKLCACFPACSSPCSGLEQCGPMVDSYYPNSQPDRRHEDMCLHGRHVL